MKIVIIILLLTVIYVNASFLICQGENECTIEEGVIKILPIENKKIIKNDMIQNKKLKLIAGLNKNNEAFGTYEELTFHIRKNQIQINVNVEKRLTFKILDRIHIFGYPIENSIKPRIIKLNGQLLRKGSLHYHQNTQSLEIFDIGINLNENVNIELLIEDKAADQIECPVSYIVRNADYTIPQSACFSPCVWDGIGCWLPTPQQYGYTVNGPIENTTFGWRIPLTKLGPPLYNNSVIQNIMAEVFIYSNNFMRLKIYDPNNRRYEVPIALNLPTQPYTGLTDFTIEYPTTIGTPFYIKVIRQNTSTVLFDTSIVGLTFEDQLLSLAIRLPSRNLYGLGESYHATFRREFDDSTWPVMSRDELPNPNLQHNLYGVHPFYEVIEEDSNAHGVLLYNSNPQEYQLQSGAPAVVWRTIGGILDFYIVTGPKPEDVVKQYTNIIGKSFLPPYWALGFQLSRWGYNNLTNMQAAIERTKNCSIPLDVFYGDVDTMDRNADFTIDPINFAGLPQFIDQQRAEGLRYVPIIDAAIPNRQTGYEVYNRGLTADAYIRLENGSVLMGNVWPPEPVSFPDFFRSNTASWWRNEITLYNQTLRFDGLWIDMNEPSNFDTNIPDPEGGYRLSCPTNNYDDPPYVPKAGVVGTVKRLSDKTICMNTRQGDGNVYTHYNVHSLYGYSQTIPTSQALQALTGKRGLVFTRSSFVGSGILGGHWTGDNTADWAHLKYSIIGLLDFNLFGLPYVGADICGFFLNTEEKLCERWQEVGAFYPFSRNHNSIGAIDQDPCIWPNTVGSSARKALKIRYRLLPFFYTMLYRANQGIDGTVIRSLVHQYPEDRETLTIDQQFLWGDALLVSPALDPDVTAVSAYFPAGLWYDYYTGQLFNSSGQYSILSATSDFIPLHIKEGKILPLQSPGSTTTASRQNPFELLIAVDSGLLAFGDFFWDDGESIDTVNNGIYHYSNITFAGNLLAQIIIKTTPNLLDNKFIETVEILGLNTPPTGAVGDVSANVIITYDSINKKTKLINAHIPININYNVVLTF